jgi:hypothetical protein
MRVGTNFALRFHTLAGCRGTCEGGAGIKTAGHPVGRPAGGRRDTAPGDGEDGTNNARDGDKRSGRGQAKRKRGTRGQDSARAGDRQNASGSPGDQRAGGDRHPGTGTRGQGGHPGTGTPGTSPKRVPGTGPDGDRPRKSGGTGTAGRQIEHVLGRAGRGQANWRRAPGDRQTARCSSFAIWAECLGVGQKRPAVINWRALRDGVSENSRRFPVASSL